MDTDVMTPKIGHVDGWVSYVGILRWAMFIRPLVVVDMVSRTAREQLGKSVSRCLQLRRYAPRKLSQQKPSSHQGPFIPNPRHGPEPEDAMEDWTCLTKDTGIFFFGPHSSPSSRRTVKNAKNIALTREPRFRSDSRRISAFLKKERKHKPPTKKKKGTLGPECEVQIEEISGSSKGGKSHQTGMRRGSGLVG